MFYNSYVLITYNILVAKIVYFQITVPYLQKESCFVRVIYKYIIIWIINDDLYTNYIFFNKSIRQG